MHLTRVWTAFGYLTLGAIAMGGAAKESHAGTATGMPRTIEVIAHRSAHEDAPENTVPGIKAAIALGVDYIELDVRETRDGHFVVMHDSTVDRTTNGKGAVSDLTLAQIEALDAGSKAGAKWAGTKVATFDEALAAMRGHVGGYIDMKNAPPDSIVAILKREDMLLSPVYASPNELAAMLKINNAVRTMPEYPGSPQALDEIAQKIRIDVVAISPLRNVTQEAVDAVKQLDVPVFVDMMADDNPAGWARVIGYGVDGIQTDRPSELLAYLRAHHLHR